MAVDQLETTADPKAAVLPAPRIFPEHPDPPRRIRPSISPPLDEVLGLVRDVLPTDRDHTHAPVRGARIILTWLLEHPGDTWQERWEFSGADDGIEWIQQLVDADPRSPTTARGEVTAGIYRLVLCRVIYPSYDFLTAYITHSLLRKYRELHTPELFAKLPAAADALNMQGGQKADGLRSITKIAVHTGKSPDEITTLDLHGYRNWASGYRNKIDRGMTAGWDMLRKAGFIEDIDLRSDIRRGQQTNAEIIDYYGIRNPDIRALLIRYLDERRPAMDFSSLRTLAFTLADLFWRDIERHHPEQKDLRLPNVVAEAWRERVRFTKPKPGRPAKPRKDSITVMTTVRAFYLDIQEWAQEDPIWAAWAAPSPVRRSDTAGQAKHKRLVQSEIHQRIRARLPHLPLLVATAEQHLDYYARLLAAADATPIDSTFELDSVTYRRTITNAARKNPRYHRVHRALVENVFTGERLDAEAAEDEAFWGWAIIETLRHTGVRIEELSEITHLALISYRIPKTGEIVPMLQIVPSKSDRERLLLVTPELASVLATVINRLRSQNDGSIPLVKRYDDHERVEGPPLPHLFQRKTRGWNSNVISQNTITTLLNAIVARAGIVDATGTPLRYTVHDFRRIFATEAVTGGLPVHIAARILGHANLATTQHYLAVFQDDLIDAYRSFLTRRRAVRPEAEYREPTPEEWQEFQDHFELRKVSLGTCGRPYGTPCQHEHACIRCPVLQVDPRQIGRLTEIVKNLQDRIEEAEMHGWAGEVEGLKVSLEAGRSKLAAARRVASRPQTTMVDLGFPEVGRASTATTAARPHGHRV